MNDATWHFVVGSAGSSTGFGILKSLLKAFPAASYTAIDSNPPHLVAAMALPVSVTRVPSADSDDYVSHVLAMLRSHATNVFVPVHDREIEVVAANVAIFPETTLVAVPSISTVNLCNDKWLTHKQFVRADVPTPETVLPEDLSGRESDFVGWLRKPRRGVGGHGVATLLKREDVEEAASLTDIIIQECCVAPEITVDALASRHGGTYAASRERVEVKAGVCTKARLFRDAAFDALTEKVSAALNLSGAFCYQAMKGLGGNWVVTDVNPRLGGGTAMWLPVGVNFAAANVADLFATPFETWLPQLENQHFVVRYFDEVLTG